MSVIRQSVVLITGASSGIGYQLAHEFSRNGAKVALMARRADRLDACRQSVLDTRPSAEVLCCPGDVTRPEDIQRIVKMAVTKWKRIDILVNNAGVGLCGTVLNTDLGDLRRTLEVNFYGPLYCIREVLPLMQERRSGHIVNISSYLAEKALPGHSLYSSSKAALTLLSEGLMLELANSGVRVTTVHPGTTDTEYQQSMICSNVPRWKPLVHGQDPARVAAAIVRAVAGNRRRLMLTHHARWFTALNRVSRTLGDWIVLFVKRKDRKTKEGEVSRPSRPYDADQ